MASSLPPSFFKILLNPSHSHLSLPDNFVSKHLQNKIPKDPIIQTSNGGYLWKLNIVKIGPHYYFTNGWSNIVKEIKLSFGDLLVFRLIDKATFRLLIYSPNGCPKILPPKIKVEPDIDSVGTVDDDVCKVDDGVCIVDDDGFGNVDDDLTDDDDDDQEDEDEDEKDDDDDDEYVNDNVVAVSVDDDDDDVDDDDEGVHIDGDDGDPFFIFTISKAHKSTLRLPAEFVGLAKIDAKKTIILTNLDEQEWPVRLLSEKSNDSERYYLASGWAEFRQNNELLEGYECVFKYIKDEDKLCLAKVTKKKRSARKWGGPRHKPGCNMGVESGSDDDIDGEDDDDDDDDDIDGDDDIVDDVVDIDGEDDDAADDICGEEDGDPSFISTLSKTDKNIVFNKRKSQSSEKVLATEDDDNDSEDDDNDDDDIDGGDGDPSFTLIISNTFYYTLLPEEFAGLPGIQGRKRITIKNLDGQELQIGMRLDKSYKKTKRYVLSAKWADFMRSNNLKKGDECVFKFIRNEDKLCLVKVTKSKTGPGRSPCNADADDNDEHDDGDDVEDDEHDVEDDDDNDVEDEDGDPFFTMVISKTPSMRLPDEFAGLPGIEDGKNLTVKNLDGEEQELGLRFQKGYKNSGCYLLSKGWKLFVKSNKLMYGDECLFKFIKSEGKLCLAKVTKKKGQGKRPRSSYKIANKTRKQDDGDGEDPFVTVTITKCRLWRLPEEFMGLPEIKAGKSITVKNLDGTEQSWSVLSRRNIKTKNYFVSYGWLTFLQKNKLSQGDECVIKFIRNEGKFCLTEVTKNKNPKRKRESTDKIVPDSPVGKKCLRKFDENKSPKRKRQSADRLIVSEAAGRKRGRLSRNGADVKRPRERRPAKR